LVIANVYRPAVAVVDRAKRDGVLVAGALTHARPAVAFQVVYLSVHETPALV